MLLPMIAIESTVDFDYDLEGARNYDGPSLIQHEHDRAVKRVTTKSRMFEAIAFRLHTAVQSQRQTGSYFANSGLPTSFFAISQLISDSFPLFQELLLSFQDLLFLFQELLQAFAFLILCVNLFVHADEGQ